MSQLLHNTRDHLKRSEDQISRHILELACDLARQVIRQELRGNTEAPQA
jgi:flagellar assembly protein FliH